MRKTQRMAGIKGKSGPPGNQNAFRRGLAAVQQRRVNGSPGAWSDCRGARGQPARRLTSVSLLETASPSQSATYHANDPR